MGNEIVGEMSGLAGGAVLCVIVIASFVVLCGYLVHFEYKKDDEDEKYGN